MESKNQIDLKFFKNWKTFLAWYNTLISKTGIAPEWDVQTKQIEACFSNTTQGIVNWERVWADFKVWFSDVSQIKQTNWDEQRRQIETLMLNQVHKELNQEVFILVFLHLGKPEMDNQKMTYHEALRVKRELEGDRNGRGGNEDMDKIKIVNLLNLIV